MELALLRRRKTTSPAPWHLRAVAVLTLLWFGFGAVRFLAVKTGAFGSIYPSSAELALFASFPALPNAFWALGVWGGLAGSALLLVRSKWAVQGFTMALVSLLGVSTYLFVLLGKSASIYDMPVALTTWFVTLASMLYATRIEDTDLLH